MLLGTGLTSLVFEVEAGAALEYHRERVAAGEFWRLVTGQLVHWSTTMLVADIGVLLLAGVLVARRSRQLLILCLVVSAAAVGAGVHFLAPQLARYRGASGIASALVVTYALDLARTPGPSRRAAGVGLVLFGVKLAYELATGTSMLSGTCPPGVAVAPVAHLIGAASGAVAWSAVTNQWSDRRPPTLAATIDLGRDPARSR
ncbi:MAG: rhombosortase [Vicinamibacterales bacterium]